MIFISKDKDLLFVVNLILTLSHGQVSVEHGFSLNANIMKTNMSPESLTAKRILQDHMLANMLKPYTIEITRPVVQAFRSHRQKYEVHLEEEKKKKQTCEAEVRAMHIAADIEKLIELQNKNKTVEIMEKEVIECLEKAEQNNDTCMSYVIKHNGLKSKSEEIRKVELLENEIVVLEAKKKKLL